MHEVLRGEFGLDADRLKPLSGGRVNRLWRCGEWVVKLYDHRQVPPERAERAIRLQDMAATAGLPVPRPRRTRSGALWAPSDEGMVVVMPFVHGRRRPRGTLSHAEAANLGSLLGGLHEVFRTVPVEPDSPAPDSTLARWGHLRQLALAVETPTDFDMIVLEAAEYVAAALKRVPPVDWTVQPWQMCHGDPHLDNILFDDTGAAQFFAHYKQAIDLVTALRAYWFVLAGNTWPARIRFREGIVKPEWTEIISMRLRAARWLEAHMAEVYDWLCAIPPA